MKIRDKIHYFFNRLDGYNKAFNCVVASRESGKTTAWELDKCFYMWQKTKRTTMIINRNISDITTAYIQTIEDDINDFLPDDSKIIIDYNVSDIPKGVVSLFISGILFGMVVALSCKVNRLKKIKLKNIGVIIFDEFIINPEFKETYLPNEVDRFKELYNTQLRAYAGKGTLKVYFIGNPYSRYNPYFLEWGAPLEKILPGTVISGDNWAIESYRICDELYAILKAKNPLYMRDDEYTQYALNGASVNDNGINIIKSVNNFKLFIVCSVGNRLIGIFKNQKDDEKIKYHCEPIKYDNINRDIYVFNIEDLLNGNTILFSPSDSLKFVYFRLAYRKNKISYSDIATFYDVKEIYNYI